MNDIRPFRGIRFDEAVVGPLGDVVCPPYDIISPDEQLHLYARNDHNAIRLEYGLQYPDDSASNSRYTRAAKALEDWLAEGVLKLEPGPALYLYEQQFALEGKVMVRRGILSAVRLTPWEEGVVLPHEETMAGPKADRLQLMRATACNLSPLFLMYDDPDGAVQRVTSGMWSTAPDAIARTDDGQTHRLWVVRGEDAEQLANALSTPQLYMADGHHRYETALAYQQERRDSDPSRTGDVPYDYALMLLVDAQDPGLVVLPTHRLVKGVPSQTLAMLESRLPAVFDVEVVPVEGMATAEIAERLRTMMARGGDDTPTLGLYRSGRVVQLLRLRQPVPKPAAGSRPLLDVDVLHEQLMLPVLGIGPSELAAGTMVTYTRDVAGALEAVDRGEAQLALLLNSTKVQQVLETALAHGKMPQKSTYFYPKAVTGMVFHRLK